MLKRFSRHSHGHHVDKPIFAETYWRWYNESFSQTEKETLVKHTPYVTTKFTEKSPEVLTIQKFFEYQKLPIPCTLQIISILRSPLTGADLNKTYYVLRMFQLSCEGLFLTNIRVDKLGNSLSFVGAENWDNVMCYMDALLFAMFANLESFEPILFIPNHGDRLVGQLSALMRVYVSLLRSGFLITTDLTARICEGLMKLGFKEAISHKQQDAAVLFESLTEILNMPLLTFKVNIKHGGKFSKRDDQKYSKERMLFVSIPGDVIDGQVPPPSKVDTEHIEQSNEKSTTTTTTTTSSEGEDILLEECLEHYFNNSISVKRELERRASLSNIAVASSFSDNPNDDSSKILFANDDANRYKPEVEQVENIEENADSKERPNDTQRMRTKTRSSTLSIWSLNDSDTKQPDSHKIREVNLPAWMFLRLLPFYTDDNVMSDGFESTAKSSKEFANRRPVLPICLKRYSFNTGDSSGERSQKRILIPPLIDLPDFVADDVDGPECSFRLILESAVCHRGNSIQSGHFVSVARKNIYQLNQTDEEAEAAAWLLYDDMKKSSRVVEKTFKEIFSTEWPYILFYRLVSTSEMSSASSLHSTAMPPTGCKFQHYCHTAAAPVAPSKAIIPTTATSTSPTKCTCIESSPALSIKTNETIVSCENGEVSKKRTTSNSDPVSDIAPNDPRFVDLRNKYYWFFTDESRNYYKEEPLISKEGSSQVSLSPQFRRNSQWSNLSNVSNVQLDKLQVSIPSEKAVDGTVGSHHCSPIDETNNIIHKNHNSNHHHNHHNNNNNNNSSSGGGGGNGLLYAVEEKDSSSSRESAYISSIWKRSMNRSPNVKVDSSESVGELRKLVSPMSLDDEPKNTAFPKTLRTLQEEQKKHNHNRHLFHKSKSKRDAYKQEKCVIL